MEVAGIKGYFYVEVTSHLGHALQRSYQVLLAECGGSRNQWGISTRCTRIKEPPPPIPSWEREILGSWEREIPGSWEREIPRSREREIPGSREREIPGSRVREIPGSRGREIPGSWDFHRFTLISHSFVAPGKLRGKLPSGPRFRDFHRFSQIFNRKSR